MCIKLYIYLSFSFLYFQFRFDPYTYTHNRRALSHPFHFDFFRMDLHMYLFEFKIYLIVSHNYCWIIYIAHCEINRVTWLLFIIKYDNRPLCEWWLYECMYMLLWWYRCFCWNTFINISIPIFMILLAIDRSWKHVKLCMYVFDSESERSFFLSIWVKTSFFVHLSTQFFCCCLKIRVLLSQYTWLIVKRKKKQCVDVNECIEYAI